MNENSSLKKKTQIHNYVTNVMYEMESQSYDIVTYIDVDTILTESLLINRLTSTIEKHPILKSYIHKENDTLFLEEDTEFNVKHHIDFEYVTQDTFDTPIQSVLNSSFRTKSKWRLLILVDRTTEKSRIVFKINHAYADGYQVIKLLTSIVSTITVSGEDVTRKFKRLTSWSETVYQLCIGTLVLIVANIKFFMYSVIKGTFSVPVSSFENQETECTKSISLDLRKIKEITKKHSITINDFLYACMIRTDYLYTQTKRQIYTVSAINVSNTKDLNNLAPLFLNIQNDLDCATLLQETHSLFNSCKYSAFIPLFSGLLRGVTPFLPRRLVTMFYNTITNSADYMYSNIIGPELDTISIPITDIHFATIAKNREIVFNIISCTDKINIICSFKKGRIEDKERFQSCIEEAYKTLLAS